MTFAGNSPAQSRKERMPEPKPMLGYEVVNGDTLYFDIINPSKVTSFRKMKGREWRRYYRLVWNFSKTYPYALVARKLIEKTDAELEENDFSRRKREKYINDIQKELFDAFEEPMRGMTVTQGQLLMKLIDREVGKSSYSIIKYYKNGIAASFFDGIFQGIGYTWVLLAMCIIREFLGKGAFGGGVLNGGAGIQIFPADYGVGMLTLPVGGFLVLACLIAAMQWALARPKKDKEESK